MKVMNLNWLHQFTRKRRRFLYGSLGATLPFLLAQTGRAASGNSYAQQGVSTATILAVIVGLVIAGFYIRGMYLVLHYASETYDVDFDITADDDRPKSRNGLIVGSFLLVILSALIISSYGWASLFLYIGPLLCLLGPIVVIVSMEVDLKKYKQILRNKQFSSPMTEGIAYEIGDRDFDSQTKR